MHTLADSASLTITAGIPLDTKAEWANLTDAAREEVRMWQRAMARLEGARPIGKACKLLAVEMGVSPSTVRRKWDAWRHSGGRWQSLLNQAKHQPVARRLEPAFIQYCVKLWEKHQRDKFKAAHRKLINLWNLGYAIPGYDRPEDHPPGLPWPLPEEGASIPAGWSYENLWRAVKKESTAFERTAIQIGLGTATARYAPKTFTTRANLWVGSHYMVDDVFHDHYIYVRKVNQKCRVMEFGILDVFSGSRFAWGCRPRLETAGAEKIKGRAAKKDGLKGEDVRLLFASALYHTGYSRRGTEIMAEHGTAAVPEAMEAMLYDATGQLLTVRRAPMTGKEQALSGAWRGQGGGNPRHKSPLEAFHNLMHNDLGFLPAQTGRNIESRPEGLHGLLDYTDDICEALLRIPAERGALLMLPMLEYHTEFLPLLADIYRAIDWRTDHALEGWIEAGHVVAEFRRSLDSDEWLDKAAFLRLPVEEMQQVSALVTQHTSCRRTRRLSPAEVFARSRGELIQVPPYVVAEIIGDQYAKERRVIGGYITFEDQEIAVSELRYESRVTTPDGQQMELRDRETYKTVCNPLDLEQLFVLDAKGRYLGVAARDYRADRADEHARHVKEGRIATRVADLLQGARDRHADTVREIAAMKRHNEAVQNGGPVTLEEKAAERAKVRRIRRERNSVEDLLKDLMPERKAPAPASIVDKPEAAVTAADLLFKPTP